TQSAASGLSRGVEPEDEAARRSDAGMSRLQLDADEEGLRLKRGQQTGRLHGLAERRLEHLASAVADDADTDALPGLAQADRGAQGACVADGVVVDADDDVVDAKTRGRGGGAGALAVDERSERRAEPATRRELGRDSR